MDPKKNSRFLSSPSNVLRREKVSGISLSIFDIEFIKKTISTMGRCISFPDTYNDFPQAIYPWPF